MSIFYVTVQVNLIGTDHPTNHPNTHTQFFTRCISQPTEGKEDQKAKGGGERNERRGEGRTWVMGCVEEERTPSRGRMEPTPLPLRTVPNPHPPTPSPPIKPDSDAGLLLRVF